MSKVFLGGTCNNSKWREDLIPKITIDFFNPVVDDWTDECYEIEMKEKEIFCDIHLYVITKEMKGVFSIAEVIDSVHNKNKTTILQVIPDGFDGGELKSLKAVVKLVKLRGGLALVSSSLNQLVSLLNSK